MTDFATLCAALIQLLKDDPTIPPALRNTMIVDVVTMASRYRSAKSATHPSA